MSNLCVVLVYCVPPMRPMRSNEFRSSLPSFTCASLTRIDTIPHHQAAAGGRGGEVENLMKLAFKAHRRLTDSRWTHDLRRLRREPRQLEFIHRGSVFAAGEIHRLGELIRDDVDHKFFRVTDIPQGIFGFPTDCSDVLGSPHSGRKRQQRRVNANAMEKGEGRKIELS